ncbi:MAG: hypothetical protein CME24_06755 [Gemmatimonadetes bacterium]|nr:hypothetical protein [Gemmatimonadota bacterium]|tara:strand:- start:277 stop:465 length:189 start_codon:yes stop_codon:yes gene_type:complete
MVTIFGWKIIPFGEDHYVLTAERMEDHPRLGSGPLLRTSPIEVLDLARGFAVTRSGTHYALA